jgi:hypothetical protein
LYSVGNDTRNFFLIIRSVCRIQNVSIHSIGYQTLFTFTVGEFTVPHKCTVSGMTRGIFFIISVCRIQSVSIHSIEYQTLFTVAVGKFTVPHKCTVSGLTRGIFFRCIFRTMHVLRIGYIIFSKIIYRTIHILYIYKVTALGPSVIRDIEQQKTKHVYLPTSPYFVLPVLCFFNLIRLTLKCPGSS